MVFRYISNQTQLIRSYYTGLGKTGVIYPAALLMAVGLGLISFNLVFFMKQLGSTPTMIGLLEATWPACYIFGCLLIRPLFNKIALWHRLLGAAEGGGV